MQYPSVYICASMIKHTSLHRRKSGRFSGSLSSPGPPNSHLVRIVFNKSAGFVWQVVSILQKWPITKKWCFFRICFSGVVFIFLISALSHHINVSLYDNACPLTVTIHYCTLLCFLVIHFITLLNIYVFVCCLILQLKWINVQIGSGHTATCS